MSQLRTLFFFGRYIFKGNKQKCHNVHLHLFNSVVKRYSLIKIASPLAIPTTILISWSKNNKICWLERVFLENRDEETLSQTLTLCQMILHWMFKYALWFFVLCTNKLCFPNKNALLQFSHLFSSSCLFCHCNCVSKLWNKMVVLIAYHFHFIKITNRTHNVANKNVDHAVSALSSMAEEHKPSQFLHGRWYLWDFH